METAAVVERIRLFTEQETKKLKALRDPSSMDEDPILL